MKLKIKLGNQVLFPDLDNHSGLEIFHMMFEF